MTNDLIYLKMQRLEAEFLGSEFDAETANQYIYLQEQLIHNLENEVDELRGPKPEPANKFYPMSKTAKISPRWKRF